MACGSGTRPSREKAALKCSDWEEGEIAYLKPEEIYTKKQLDLLKQPHGLHAKATNHPVIILKKGSRTDKGQFYLVTPISAFSSGRENNYLPPWEQRHHSGKAVWDFRSFAGSKLSNGKQKALRLKPGQSMPKPKTSWVYVQSNWIVPESVLGPFTKSRSQLQLTQETLGDLVSYMTRRCNHFKGRLGDPRIRVSEPLPSTITPMSASTSSENTQLAETTRAEPLKSAAQPAKRLPGLSWARVVSSSEPSVSSETASEKSIPVVFSEEDSESSTSSLSGEEASGNPKAATSAPEIEPKPQHTAAKRLSWSQVAKASAAPRTPEVTGEKKIPKARRFS